jgi:intracellular septation protein A
VSQFLAAAAKIGRTVAYDFGGIVVFYALLWLVGLKAAIAGTLVFVAFDIWRRRHFGIGFPRLYVLTTSLAIVFGIVDLASKTPFMLKFEGAVSAFVVGVFFALGARGRSVIEELLTQQAGPEAVAFPHARRFYQLMTLTWAVYYVLMSCFYLWVGLHYPYLKAIGIRQVAGLVGVGVMMLLSVNMMRLYAGFRRIGLIPTP